MDTGKKQKHAGEKEPKAETGKSENSINSVSKWWHDPSHVIQSIGILIGSVVAIIYGCQLYQMIQSNEINRKALESVQRAFVTFTGMETDTAPISTNPVTFIWDYSAKVENSGTTPAIHAIEHFFWANDLPDEPNDEQFLGKIPESPPISEIGPRSTHHLGPSSQYDIFLLGTFPILSIGTPEFHKFEVTRRVFFWGYVGYRDVFENTPTHLTEFCVEVSGIAVAGSKAEPKPLLRFRNCKQHNCTDKNCPDYAVIARLIPK